MPTTTEAENAKMETRGTLLADGFSGDEEDDIGSQTGGCLKRAKRLMAVSTMQCTFEGCDKEFGSRWSLMRHLCTHTGEKKFECLICGKEFVQKCSLRRHEQTHTDSKTWVCNHANCGKQFKLKEYLDVHRRTHLKADSLQNEHLINTAPAVAVSTALNQTGLCDQLRQRLVRMSLRHRMELTASSTRFNALEKRLSEYEIGFLEAMTLLTAVVPDGLPAHLVALMEKDVGREGVGVGVRGGSSSSADQGHGGPAHKRARIESSSSQSTPSSSSLAATSSTISAATSAASSS